MFSVKRLFRSFRYAFKGFLIVLKEEQSFQIQLIAGAVVVSLIFYFNVRGWESMVLILLVVAVLVMELINSIFERIIDVLKPRLHPYVEEIKDIMAATVLLSSLVALVIGLMIFLPYLKNLL